MAALFVSTLLLMQLFCQVLVAVKSRVESGRVLPPGYVKFFEDNAAFNIYEIRVKWEEARARCIRDGGHLAVGTSLAKIQRINSTKPHTGRWAHGGIYRSATTRKWLRVDNDQPLPSESVRWSPGYPVKFGGCTAISMKDAGAIVNFDCNIQKSHFACEIPLNGGLDGKRGPVGACGLTGAKGEPGVPGIPGGQGERGVDGPTGPQGPPGEPGPHGDAGEEGQVGAPGPSGPIGPIGWPGIPGVDGIDGAEGLPGEPGQPGQPGYDGWIGSIGPPGPSGPMGPMGWPSPAGEPGMKGEPGPPGPGCNATWLALLAACQEQSRGSSLMDGGESATSFENRIRVEQKWVSHQNFIEPEVRKESTEKTCRDLFVAHPDKPSGEYWINPSIDGTSDKIFVHCDAETRSTCITPAINQSQVIIYEGEEREVWLSEHERGLQITYTANDHQINALQFLSSNAVQKVTYHCMQSVGYFDAEGQTYERGLKLSAWTEVEITPRGRQRLRYDVISDECQNRSDEWRETVIAYRTSRPVLLPILDVAEGPWETRTASHRGNWRCLFQLNIHTTLLQSNLFSGFL